MYEFNNARITLKITYKDAMYVLPDYGLKLLSLFEESNLNSVMNTLVLNDELTINLWWYYVEKHVSVSKEEALDNLTPESLERFRDEFWNAVIAFSSPLKKEALKSIWKEMKTKISELLVQGTVTEKSSDSVSDQE